MSNHYLGHGIDEYDGYVDAYHQMQYYGLVDSYEAKSAIPYFQMPVLHPWYIPNGGFRPYWLRPYPKSCSVGEIDGSSLIG